MSSVNFIDLFCGIGSFHKAFVSVGYNCVLACDISAAARETYETNYNLKPFGDICYIDPSTLPRYDVVCAGFPCQPFSQIGFRNGSKDNRGTLFDQIVKFLKCKPRYVVLENVRGLLSSDNGRDFARMVSMLETLGYNVSHRILRCWDYGIPQLRRRLFVVASLSSLASFKWPKPSPNTCPTLSDYMSRNFERKLAFTIRCGGRRSSINDRHNWDTYIVDGKEYTLSIEDCKKLQGFSDDFNLCGSATAQWKLLGNTIPTNMSSEIALSVHRHLTMFQA